MIEGYRIKAVGTKGSVAIPSNSRVISAAGKTILPGLIDAHIHLRDWMLPLFTYYGVTTVYDTGNPTEWILAQRRLLAKGRVAGPRLFATGLTLDGPEERADMNHPSERGGYRTHVDTAERAAALVRQLKLEGVDGIKVHEGLTNELLRAVGEEAHRQGLEPVGHSINARNTVRAGMKFIEHTAPIALATANPDKLKDLDEHQMVHPEFLMEPARYGALIDLMVKEGVYFNPTLLAHWRLANPRARELENRMKLVAENPDMAFVPAAVRRSWSRPSIPASVDPELAEGFQKVLDFTRQFTQAGGKVLSGSDTGAAPGLGLHAELRSLVDAGLTPMQAIQSATRWAAEQMRSGHDLGTVEPGKLADLIVIEGDPLQEISSLENVRVVVKDGQVLDRKLDPKFSNPLPRAVYDGGPAILPRGLTPRLAPQGTARVELTIEGRNFTPQSLVRFDTSDLPTRFVSATQLTATLGAAQTREHGTYAVTVVQPGSGGGVSNVVYFVVDVKD